VGATRWRIAGWGLALLALANAGAVVALWVSGLDGADGASGALADVARLCGLLGAYLVLIALVLLARLPVLDRIAGFARLTRWHRLAGTAGLALVLAHAVLITVAYALADDISVPAELERLITGYPGVITAIAGLALLTAVAVSSAATIRRRLRYESWYFLHLYAYLGVALAFSHQLAAGTAFVGRPTARAYWTALYVATLGVLVGFRLVLPVARSLGHRLRAWYRWRSPASRSTACGRGPASTSAGASSPATIGGRRTRSRSPRPRTRSGCGSPSRAWGTTPRGCAHWCRGRA
jgi:predicted ferric reductase